MVKIGENGIKIIKSDGQKIPDNSYVKVKRTNHIVELTHMTHRPKPPSDNLLKLSKTEYLDKRTGEIKEYNLSENRGNNYKGLRETFKKIRDLINNNFTGAQNELFITLTYEENMTDNKRLYNDFKKFWLRFTRKYGKGFEYISIVEPQGRGAWHCHLLLKSDSQDRLFIPANDIIALWQQGRIVKVKSLNDIDNIGAYLSAYLADIEITSIAQIEKGDIVVQKEVDGQQKKFIKGGRLHLYPSGMNIYRKSSGIKYPEITKEVYSNIKKELRREPKFKRTITIEDSGKVLNQITYEQYNMKK